MVYDLIRELPDSLLTLAHQGPKAYSEFFDLVHRREAERHLASRSRTTRHFAA
jgi:putative transposase